MMDSSDANRSRTIQDLTSNFKSGLASNSPASCLDSIITSICSELSLNRVEGVPLHLTYNKLMLSSVSPDEEKIAGLCLMTRVTCKPVSSRSSRLPACSILSPGSMSPAGKPYWFPWSGTLNSFMSTNLFSSSWKGTMTTASGPWELPLEA